MISAMDPSLEQARAVLSRTPSTLRAWLSGLPDVWLTTNEGPGTYSAFDVVGHLLSGEADDWIPRVECLLEHGEARTFEPFDRESFRTRYEALDLEVRLDAFEQARADSLATLEALALSESDLARTGTHPAFGRVTLAQLLSTWVVHDLTHLAQIARVMGRRYKDAVGPWVEYLPLL